MGKAIGIFPEGMSNSCAHMGRGHPGAAHIALHTNVPIIPVAISGTEKLKHINVFRHPKIAVTIGQPFYLPTLEGKLTSAQVSEATDLVMAHIATLLPKGYRGAYG
jgi:1-acyl-sn-glycerol-3-phosphate acyltransferase